MSDEQALQTPMFSASIEVGIPSDDHLAYLGSIPSAGTTHDLIDLPRTIYIDLINLGLIRTDGMERSDGKTSVHLTACGRLVIRDLEEQL